MLIEEIKDPVLKKLLLIPASGTIENDASDALEESSDDEEFVQTWQGKLESLYRETQYYWGELENMKSGKEGSP